MSARVLSAEFVTTATEPKGYPTSPAPEVAFVGRSNVGKSSMINKLAMRKKLVRVSHTPGRTRTLNFFDVTLAHKGGTRIVRLCDLPGYGFAKASKTDRADWQQMIAKYLETRRDLKVIVTIIDAEVGPTSDDLKMLDYLVAQKPKLLVAATKIDRINKARRKPRVIELQKTLELPPGTVVGFSSHEGIGHGEMWDILLASI
ncbi:MAG: GTP-binding protein EngB [Myxococcaceae bacterium]|nr:GTP-binding protein EngB [Myxococcaceae bacterium]